MADSEHDDSSQIPSNTQPSPAMHPDVERAGEPKGSSPEHLAHDAHTAETLGEGAHEGAEAAPGAHTASIDGATNPDTPFDPTDSGVNDPSLDAQAFPGAATPDMGSHAADAASGGGASGLAATAVNGANAAMFFAIQGVRAVVGLFGKAGSKISSATHGTVSSFAGGMSVASVLGLLFSFAITPILFGGSNNLVMEDNGDEISCKSNVQNAADMAGLSGGGGASTGEISKQMEDTAKKTTVVLLKMGMNKIEAAGALGNIQMESNVDPTSIQGIYNEPFNIDGPKKKAARDTDTSSGIGLIQWTPENPKLRAYAKAHGTNWWNLDIQLKYFANESEWPGDVKRIIASGSKTPQEAAYAWMHLLEKPKEGPTAHLPERQASAVEWAAKIASWNDLDSSYADSIVSQAGVGNTDAGQNGVSAALANCREAQGTNGSNSSLAEAAVSYAWPFYKQSVDDVVKGQENRGTPLYQNLHYAIWGGNDYGLHPLSSCDNGVSTAVQWSGADENMPEQSSDTIKDYLETGGTISNTWKKMNWTDRDVSKLQPGDIVSKHGHIFIYVGNETLMKFYNNDKSKFEKGGDMVSSSMGHRPGAPTPWVYDRSPGVGVISGDSLDGDYDAYRLQKATGSKFTSFKPSSTVVDLKPFSGGSADTRAR